MRVAETTDKKSIILFVIEAFCDGFKQGFLNYFNALLNLKRFFSYKRAQGIFLSKYRNLEGYRSEVAEPFFIQNYLRLEKTPEVILENIMLSKINEERIKNVTRHWIDKELKLTSQKELEILNMTLSQIVIDTVKIYQDNDAVILLKAREDEKEELIIRTYTRNVASFEYFPKRLFYELSHNVFTSKHRFWEMKVVFEYFQDQNVPQLKSDLKISLKEK